MGDLIVIGGGEHGRVVMDVATTQGWRVLGFLDPLEQPETTSRGGVPWLGPDAQLPALLAQHPHACFACGIGGNATVRQRVVAAAALPDARWARIIHPAAVVSPQATLGVGCQILARAVVQTGATLGAHCIINSAAVVEHDVQVGAFAHLAPGALTGGGCKVGDDTLVGIGARLRDHVTVGAGCTVGAGSVVISDIPAGSTVVGVPAVAIRASTAQDIGNIMAGPATTLHDAMAAMASSGITIVLVIDPARKLLGTLTDGDIRRALLAGHSMSEPVSRFMNSAFTALRENVPRAAALALMAAHQISHLPVLDAQGRVQYLHLLAGLIGGTRLPLVAVIMAGGQGARLRPLTEHVPKPMLRVAGRPILEHLVLHLAASQVREIYLAVNYLGGVIEQHFGTGELFGCHIHYLREEQALGTAGALHLLPQPVPVGTSLLVLNGDLITQANIDRLYATHVTDGNALTVGVRDYQVEIPFGVLEVDGRRVKAVREKPRFTYLTNAGIYIVSPTILPLIPPDRAFSMVDLLDLCLVHQHQVGIHLLDGDWMDIGRHEELARARGL